MKSFITIFILLFSFQFSFSQTKLGLRLSYGICKAQTEEQFFVNGDNRIEYKFSFMEHRNSRAIGLFLQKKVGFIYLQPEFLYRNTEIVFEMIDFFSRDYTPHPMKEKYHFFHVPITAGMHFENGLRIGAGPVFNYLLEAETHMEGMANITERQNKLQYGFQAGLGFDYKIFYLDIKYEIAFSKVGEHIYYTESKHAFNTQPNLINFSVGIAL